MTRVLVWLRSGEFRVFERFCRCVGKSKSAVLRDSLLVFLNGEVKDDLVKRVVLERELERLFREEKQLRRVQNKILSNAAYLRQYAKLLVHGGWEDHTGRFRPPLASSPDSALLIKAFEGVFSHRSQIGRHIAEISLILYPGEYGLTCLPSSDQNTCYTPVNNVRDQKRKGEQE